MKAKVNNDLVDISEIYTKISGDWKQVLNGYTKVNGIWKEIYQSYPYNARIEYIESTGTQYIDTEINVASDIRLVVDGEFTVASSSQQMGSGSTNIFNSAFVFGIASSKWIFRSAGSSSQSYGTADTNRHVFSIESGIGKVDSTSYTVPAYSQSTDGDHMYVFARHNGSNIYGACKFKMYSCQIYKNDVLVRDFIPVIDNQDVACLYDKISKSLFYNIGTGDFSVPS